MEVDMDDEPLDFELEVTLPKPVAGKRKKTFDMDDLIRDSKKDEERRKKINSSRRVEASSSSAEDDEEKILSRAVNGVHQMIKEMDGQDNPSNGLEVKDDIPVWGMQVLGTQKTSLTVECPAVENSELFQKFISFELNSLVELSPAEGEGFLERYLLNGWLLNYALNRGYVEEVIAKWSLNLLLFSQEESLSSGACDFWCSIMLHNKVGSSPIKIEWLPSYSLFKGALESYGFELHSLANMPSDMELDGNGPKGKALLNLRAWIKLVDASCQARSMFSANQMEELVGYVICLLLDRRLQGLSACLNQCICSCIGFFEEEEWNASCEAVAKFLACRVPRDMNCLRIVECISGINSRSKMLRSRTAFDVLKKLCFKEAVDAEDILRALISINVKWTRCSFFDIYIYIVLTENLLISDDLRDEKIDEMWATFLRKCSTHINNTNFRPYAQEVRNRASYLLQSSSAS